ncbi:MAG: transglycosylase SLT domain-containing protein [Halomonas sp.]|uniref:transglycosylase SLT domain-containing protein n=1 Tax=Halomonas sp. TaxID=1486246 RepID=UPI002ACDBD43|nr:transglycosylase SLT domain-containing protein [Halomonas sp.]MDZ7853285.1 transglycosylase SLT domain-containing protein [Halomonas sp.]
MAACLFFANTALAQGDGDFIAALPDSLSPDQPAPFVRALPETPASLRGTLDSIRSSRVAPAEIWAARQWLNDMEPRLARYLPEPARRRELLGRIHHEARLAGLAPELVLAVIQVESAFKAEAVSSAGAVGLMQIMPFWIRELGLPADDLKDPRRNLRYGCTILAHYLAVESGDLTRALARYNGSLGKTWYPERVMRALARHWSPASSVPVRTTAER